LTRRIFPVVLVATAHGVERVSDATVAQMMDTLMESRMVRPDGPGADLT